MLIDFSVQNYRSIKNNVTLSAIASKPRMRRASKRGKIAQPDDEIAKPYSIPGRSIDLLPVIGIFGANASGKTNVVLALEDLLGYMAFGGAKSPLGSVEGFVPFMFDKRCRKAPTRMQLRVSTRDGVIYEYFLEVRASHVEKERLKYIPAYPKRMLSRLVFERNWSAKRKRYEWNNGKLLGENYKELQSSLNEREPFIHFLTQRLKVEALQPLAKWVYNKWPGELRFQSLGERMLVPKILHDAPIVKDAVVGLIRSFDTGIDNIEVERAIESDNSSVEEMTIWATHKIGSEIFRLPFSEESTGTQRLCELASKMLLAFISGALMIGDELSSSVHPNITRRLIELFQSEKTNSKRAQLLFTSHDNTLQKSGLLRRDQIWFTEKKSDGSTDLYPLTDFRPRNDLAIDKAYLDGRFGAVPIIPQDLGPLVKQKKR
jgi:uncharacterized protein